MLGKSLVSLSIVISIATFALGYINKAKLTKASAEAKSANRLYADAKTALERAKAELGSARTPSDSVKGQIDSASSEKLSAEKKAADMQAAAQKAQDLASALQTKLEQREAELAKIKTERQQTVAHAALATAVPPPAGQTSTPADAAKLLAEKDATIKSLQARLASSSGPSSRIVSSPRPGGGLNGRILSVNKPWNLAVIDIGSRSGVARDTELAILDRNDVSKLAGKIRVTFVEPNSAIAEIVELPEGAVISPGDFAVSK